MNSFCKRTIGVLLALVMLLSVLPAGVLAEQRAPGDPATAVSDAAELQAALDAGAAEIVLAADFAIDRTICVTGDVTIRADAARRLTRAADFAGELFVIGENAAGEACTAPVSFTLGEAGGAAITVDGNKSGLAEGVAVNGAALFVVNGASVELFDNVEFVNHRKDENLRTLDEKYALSSADSVGGAAIVVLSGLLTAHGTVFTDNEAVGEGGAVFFAADSEGLLEGTVFGGNAALDADKGCGGAVAMRSASVSLLGASFTDNAAARHGGALYVGYTSASGHASTAILEDCAFTENTGAYHGGAVYVTSGTLDEAVVNLLVSGTEFTDNAAANNGGALYLSDSNAALANVGFTGNSASPASEANGGGAIYSTGSLLDANVARFINNQSGVNAGAIALYSGSAAKLNAVNAVGNTAQNNGGFVYNSGSDCRLYDSELRQNSAVKNGGAFALHSTGTSGIYNTQLVENSAGNNGGAIYDYTGASETLAHSCAFTGNTAANFGGALFASNASILKVCSCSATGNSAGSGGVLYETTTGTAVTLNGMTVSGNTASSGPIVFGNTTKALLNLNKTNFTDSDHEGELDAAYWAAAIANKLTVNEITDEIPGYYNYAGEYVGETHGDPITASDEVASAEELEAALNAGLPEITLVGDFEIDRTLYVSQDTVLKNDAVRTLTRAADFTGDLFVIGENSAGEASASPVQFTLGQTDGPILTLDGNKDGRSEGVTVNGSALFVGNGASIELCNNLRLVNHRKDGNARTLLAQYALGSADSIGGAALLVASGAATVRGAAFENNESFGEGGAVYFAADSTGVLANVCFNENAATDADEGCGGALALRSATVSVNESDFTGNRAARHGGAIYESYTSASGHGSALTLTACGLENNESGYHGGAIYVTSDALDPATVNLTADGVSFVGNSAANNGGALYLSSSSAKLNELSASGNTAQGNAGFAYCSGADLKLYDSELLQNGATGNGGAISLHSASTAGLYNTCFTENTAVGNGGALYDYTGATETTVHSCTFTANTAGTNGGAILASNASLLNLYNCTASGNSAGSGGVLYETTTATTVTVIGLTVSGNTATGGPLVYGNTTKAILNVNKVCWTDEDVAGALDAAYWTAAFANKLKVNEIDDPIPGYYDYHGNYHAVDTPIAGVTDVRTADALETAIEAGAPRIRITADFELDRTFYITGETEIFSTATHTLTRAANFGGDLFVVGEDRDGNTAALQGGEACLTLGDPESALSNLLIFDGNKANMQVDVNGTVLFLNASAKANVYENVTMCNHRKVGNERTALERYSLPYTNRIGGAVAIVANGVLSIYGGRFEGNEVNDEGDGDDEAVKNSTLGAVIFNYSNLYVYGGSFEHNQAARAGAIYNYRMARVYGGSFRGNTATKIGGVFYQANSQYAELLIGSDGAAQDSVLFENNSSAGIGGAIYTQSKAVVVVYGGTTFRGNRSAGSNGGAICAYGTLTAQNVFFENNSAYQRGGAVYATNADDTLTTRIVSITDSTFRGNRANRGGAIGVYASEAGYSDGGRVRLTRCAFESNCAVVNEDPVTEDVFGGAIYVGRKGTLDVTDSSFTGNEAFKEGGAVYITGSSDVTMRNTDFSGNRATREDAGVGGALSVHSAKLSLSGGTLRENYAAKNGGALYVSYTGSSAYDAEVVLDGVCFDANSVGNYGAAVYVTSHEAENSGMELTAERISFTNNHSPFNGGALYITGGSDAYLHDCEFIGNTADGNAVASGSRYGGGAIYASGSNVELNKASFTDNVSGYNGGAIALYSEARMILNEVTAVNNQAANNGGFVYVNGAALRVYASSLADNAGKGGGAVNAYTGADVEIYDSVLAGNTASGNGGALYAYTDGTPVTVRNCTLSSNGADKYGGAVYASSVSVVHLLDVTARGNSAQQGGFLYETTANTEVTANGVTLAQNTATDAGPIVYGNAKTATLRLNKGRWTDEDVPTPDADYWAAAIVNKLKVVEIDEVPGAYTGYSHDDPQAPANDPPVLAGVETIFALAENSYEGPVNETYDAFPRLDPSSNFMSRETTLFENINGADVTVDTFVFKPGVPSDNPNFAQGLLIYQAMLYKRNHPDEDVSIDISSFRFSVNTAVCLNRGSRYFGYERALSSDREYDKYGFVKIAYLLVEAAAMGIRVNIIGQMDAYPLLGTYTFEQYFTRYLDAACDPAYAPGQSIRDYMDFQFCYWTSYGEDAATDMMHTKLCAVSAYTDMNGVDHQWAVWTSSANLDGVNTDGTNGNNKCQTGTIVSGHEAIYRTSVNYLRLMANYCGQEDIYLFRELVIRRTAEQLQLLDAGRGGEIPADEQLVYVGTPTDDVFELWFTPLGTDSGVWDAFGNPYCKYVDKLTASEGPISFSWNNANFVHFPLSTMLLDKVATAFHSHASPENRLFIMLKGVDEDALRAAYADLTIGEDIGSISLNKRIYSDIHNKDLQFSYVENGAPVYVTLFNSLNIHNGSMFYQSNFILVVKEHSGSEGSVYFALADNTSTGIVGHEYGELQRKEPTATEHGCLYRECVNCGRIEVEQELHSSFGAWIIDKEAVGDQPGVRHRVCSVCGTPTEACEYYADGVLRAIDRTALCGIVYADGARESTGALTAGAHTFEALVQLDPSVVGRGGVILGNNANGSGSEINLEIYTSGRVRLFARENGSADSCTFNTDVRGDKPVHIAVTVDGTRARLYLDGVLAETKTLAATLPEACAACLVGADYRMESGPYFKGRIYSAALFSDVRSAEEIALDALLVSEQADGLLYSAYYGYGRSCPGKDELDRVTTVPLTIEAELELDPAISGRGGIVVGNFSARTNPDDQFSFEIYNNGQPRLYWKTADGEFSVLFNADVRADGPVQLALVIDGLEARLYLDGALADTQALPAAVPANAANFKVGSDNRPYNSQKFKGTIFSLSLYDAPKSADELAAGSETGLLCKARYDGVSLAHRPGEWIVDRPATAGQPGIRHRVCAVCGQILEAEEIPAEAETLAYDYTAADGIACPAGETEFLYLGDLAAAPRTFEATILLPRSQSARAGVLFSNYGYDLKDQISIEIYTNGRPRLYYTVNSTVYNYYFTTDVRSDSPVQLALTLDGSTATLWLDGAAVETLDLSVPVPAVSRMFCVGGDNRNGNAQYFKGLLYSAAMFSDVRTADELALDRVLVTQDADALLWSRYFSGERRATADHDHAAGERIVDRVLSGQCSGVSHVECSVCGQLLQAWELSDADGETRSLDLTVLEGIGDGAQASTGELPAAAHTFETIVQLDPDFAGRGGVILGNNGNGSGLDVNLELYTDGRVRLFARGNGVTQDCVFSTDVRSSEPVHLAVTVDGEEAKLYVNGALAETKTLSAALPDARASYRIGCDYRLLNGPYFKGRIYAAALFSDARTAEEVALDAILVPENADGLLYSAYYDGFDRSCGGADIGAVQQTPVTIEAVLKLAPGYTARGGVIVGNFSAKTNPDNQFSFEIYSNGQPRLYWKTADGEVSVLFNADVRSENETQLALVLDGLEARLYLNGALADTQALPAEVPATAANFKVGGDNRANNAQYFKGTLYSIALYDRVKTEAELFDGSGAGLCYLADLTADEREHLPGEWIVDLEATATATGIRHRACAVCDALLEVEETPAVHPAGISYDRSAASGRQFTEAADSMVALPAFANAPRTIEATVTVPRSMSTRAGVVVSNYQTASADQISLEIYLSGRPRLFMVIDGTKYDLLFTTDIRSDEAVQLAITLDDDSASLWVDGVWKETLALPKLPAKALSGFTIGGDARTGNAQYFKGTVWSVALFSDVRMAEELAIDTVLVTDDPALLSRSYFVD